MIEINGVTKKYGAKTAVEDVSFTATPGRVTGFLGPNGAGKSSTLRILLGLDRPTAGTALIDATTKLVVDADAFAGTGDQILLSAGTLAADSIPATNIVLTGKGRTVFDIIQARRERRNVKK